MANRILQSNIPRDHFLQVSLLGSKAVKEIVDFGLKDFEWKGEFAEECNKVTRNYYLEAAENTFPNKANHPLTLREYRLFFSYAMPTKVFNDTAIMKVKDVRRSLISAISSNGMYCEVSSIESVCGLLREIINFQYEKLTQYNRNYSEDKDISNQVVDPSTSYLIKPSHILISSIDEYGEEHNTRAMGFHLSENPGEHFLWQNGNIIADLLQVERGITSPFIFTMILTTEEQTSSTNEANRKFFDLEKKANGGFSRFIPSVKREFQEWEVLRNSLLNGQSSLTNYFVGIRVFCADDDDVMMRESEKVLKAFEGQGLKIIRSDFMQLRDWFASIPFIVPNNIKYWNDFKKTGSVLRAETFQAVNLLPLIGDNKLSRSGILLPSYRNQVAFLDLFDENLPTTNYNWYMSATSGAGNPNLMGKGMSALETSESGKAIKDSVINNPKVKISQDSDFIKNSDNIRKNAKAISGINGQQCVNQVLSKTAFSSHFCEKDNDVEMQCKKTANVKWIGDVRKENKTFHFSSFDFKVIDRNHAQIIAPENGVITGFSLSSCDHNYYHNHDHLGFWSPCKKRDLSFLGVYVGNFNLIRTNFSIDNLTRKVTKGEPLDIYRTRGRINDSTWIYWKDKSSGNSKKPTMYITLNYMVEENTLKPQIEWDNNCPADTGNAVEIKAQCTQPAETRIFEREGQTFKIHQDCWEHSYHYIPIFTKN